MDIKRKACDIQTWQKNIYFSTYPPGTLIHLSHRFINAFTSAAPKSLTVVSATSAPPVQPLRHQRNVCHQCRTAYATNTSRRKEETFRYEYHLH
jgi:hypothetical protein